MKCGRGSAAPGEACRWCGTADGRHRRRPACSPPSRIPSQPQPSTPPQVLPAQPPNHIHGVVTTPGFLNAFMHEMQCICTNGQWFPNLDRPCLVDSMERLKSSAKCTLVSLHGRRQSVAPRARVRAVFGGGGGGGVAVREAHHRGGGQCLAGG